MTGRNRFRSPHCERRIIKGLVFFFCVATKSTCNVIWRNPVHAANALLGVSVDYDEGKGSSESFLKNVPDTEEGEVEEGEVEESKFAKRLPPQGTLV